MIVAGTGPRAVVTTASYEARRFGVGSAMPAARARRLCPDGVFLAPDFAYYREASREVMAIVRSHVETVEVVGLDEAYLELTGLPAPHAAMRLIAREIERETALGCSIGIGPSKLVAKVASDAEKPRGFVVLTREQACARFARLAVRAGPGDRPEDGRAAARASASTRSPSSRPRRRRRWRSGFGPRFAAELQRRARFEDDSPVTEQRKVVSESRETTFDHDIADRERLEQILDGLVERLCAALARPATRAAARSGSRSGSTTSRPTPARARWPSRSARPSAWGRWRSICCGGSRRRGRCGCSACGWRDCSRSSTDREEQLTLAVLRAAQ